MWAEYLNLKPQLPGLVFSWTNFGAICQRLLIHVKSQSTVNANGNVMVIASVDTLPFQALPCVIVVVIVNEKSLNLFI